MQAGFKPIAVEITLNPDGKGRGLGVAEFSTTTQADHCVENFKSPPGTKAYARPLVNMFFPDVVNGCCSLKTVLANPNIL